jgi:hypothetical protein
MREEEKKYPQMRFFFIHLVKKEKIIDLFLYDIILEI